MIEVEDKNTEEEEDKKWIWGLFYFNPDDKRIFPRKRVQWMGWTVNFANPYSLIANGILIAAAIYVANRLI